MFSDKQPTIGFFIPYNYLFLIYRLISIYKSILSEMNTGKIVTNLREQNGWSQTELADKSGVSRVMIGK